MRPSAKAKESVMGLFDREETALLDTALQHIIMPFALARSPGGSE